jgi:hypothetical protein
MVYDFWCLQKCHSKGVIGKNFILKGLVGFLLLERKKPRFGRGFFHSYLSIEDGGKLVRHVIVLDWCGFCGFWGLTGFLRRSARDLGVFWGVERLAGPSTAPLAIRLREAPLRMTTFFDDVPITTFLGDVLSTMFLQRCIWVMYLRQCIYDDVFWVMFL